MRTLRLNTDREGYERAGELIREGKLVAFPTETVYGLGADALNEEAVRSVYRAKGRPSDNPMIVHIADQAQVSELVISVSDTAEKLMQEFWPGPITFILSKSGVVPKTTTGGLDTVAVRMPESEEARALITAAKRPIAAPSANISGRPSPTNAEDVLEDMDGIIDAVIMGAACRVGIESTVLDLTGDAPTILRPGFVTPEMIEQRTGIKVNYDRHLTDKPIGELDPENGAGEIEDFAPKSPGMKYKHYAPKAKVILVQNNIEQAKQKEEACGAIVSVLDYGADSEEAARRFFADLRELDREGVDVILVHTLDESGLGFSIMNRMLKSAGYEVIV